MFARDNRKSQSGFESVGIILVVLVFAAIGITGYFVYQHKKNDGASTSNSYTFTNTAGAPQSNNIVYNPAVYSGWTNYTDPTNTFSVQFPSNFSLASTQLPGFAPTAGTTKIVPNNLTTNEQGWGAGLYINLITKGGVSDFQTQAFNDGESYNPTVLSINGYPSLYHQLAESINDNGNSAATFDYYAISRNNVTLLIHWQNYQASTKSLNGYNLSSEDPTFRAIVESVKFEN